MSDVFDEILASLPEKRSRSRLELYGELIHKLLRRGRGYREIAAILLQRCHVHASISTIHNFVRIRAITARKQCRAADENGKTPRCKPGSAEEGNPINSNRPQERPIEIRQRTTALKFRQPPAQTEHQQFKYDPNEPLRVPTKTGPDTAGSER